VTQTWVPSEETPSGPLPTLIVWTTVLADAAVTPAVRQSAAAAAAGAAARAPIVRSRRRNIIVPAGTSR
jgi:hypothetical protein